MKRPVVCSVCSLLSSFACLLVAGSASADVSSWAYAGFGPGILDFGAEERERLVLEWEAGVGSAPAAWVFGGVFRGQSFLGDGTDLSLLARGASRGYVQGAFGFALDLGAYQRFWGEGSTGVTSAVVFGIPWGITLRAGGGLGTNDQRFASLTLGLDFARLTVYRTEGTGWFANPFATDERGRGSR